MPMHADDLTYSLEMARCPEATALLAEIASAAARVAEHSATINQLPRGPRRSAAALRSGELREGVMAARRHAEKIVIERGWQRRLPTDGYDGSYIGHSDD